MSWITTARRKGEKNARQMLERLGDLSLPIPIKEIAISEGCLVRSSLMEDGLSGMAFIKDCKKHIVYNAGHHINRQRFTIAHELAHHVMDGALLNSSVHVDRGTLRRDHLASDGTDKIEIAANAFAACILMPEDLIRKECGSSIDLEDEARVADLARRFKVSQAAFTNRVLNLSLD